jgi:hypothetical protein
MDRPEDADIVYENVDASGFGNESRQSLGAAEVGEDADGARTHLRADALNGLSDFLLGAAVDDDLGTFSGRPRAMVKPVPTVDPVTNARLPRSFKSMTASR